MATLYDSLHKTPTYSDSGFPMIRVTDIRRGFVDTTDAKRVNRATYLEFSKKHKPAIGDVLFSRVGSYGNSSYVNRREEFCLGQNTVCITPDSTIIDPLFFYLCLNSDFVRDQIDALVGGASQPTISLENIQTLRLPCPPLPLQRRISSVLFTYDEVIENNMRRIQILDSIARTFPLSAVSENCEEKELGEIAEDVRRNVPKGKLDEAKPYVGLEHIPRRSLALDSWETPSDLGSNKLEFKKGEILFGKIRPYFHKVSIAPFDGICSADTIVIRARDPEYFPFVAACVSSDPFVAHASATANGAKMPRANWAVLKKYEVAIPKGENARRFSALFSAIVAQQQALIFQIKNLRRTRDLLLPRLLSGNAPLRYE